MTDQNHNTEEVVVSVAIYIHGTDLDPARMTQALSVEPSDSWRRGDMRDSKHGKIGPKKKGMWSLYIQSTNDNIDESIANLLSKLGDIRTKISNIPEIEDAYLDIFVAPSKSLSFLINSETASSIAQTGLPVQFTFSL